MASDRIYGVVTAEVVDTRDPQNEGRVLVRFPWMDDDADGHWAPVAVLMAGGGRGTWFRPRIGDQALCAFEQGDKAHPYVVGYLWHGEDRPPEDDQDLRVIHSENGHTITISDPSVSGGDTGYVRVADAHGNTVELSNARIEIISVGQIDILAPTVTINGRPVLPIPQPI